MPCGGGRCADSRLLMGVITTCRLDEGTVFGPVPPTMTLADPIVLIGHRTSDTLLDIHTVKVRPLHSLHARRSLSLYIKE